MYKGSLSRIATGRTEFTAQFIGIPIISPTLDAEQVSNESDISIAETTMEEMVIQEPTPIPDNSQEPMFIEVMTVEQVHIGGIIIEAERESPAQDAHTDRNIMEDNDIYAPENEHGELPIAYIIITLVFIIGLVIA
jgi:hypothetical protein